MMLRNLLKAAVLAWLIILAAVNLMLISCRHYRSGGPVTWYVRPDGGTRYSDYNPSGQCDGQGDAAYPGSGVNQHCAFKDIRALWADGSYTTSAVGYPKWGWVGQGGDTYIIDCPADCRIGYNGPNSNNYSPGALAGEPYKSGAPPALNGTADRHTRILGRNWEHCQSDESKAHLNGGYGVGTVLSVWGSSYVDVACFDITDHSNCGKAGQTSKCQTSYPLGDYADNGMGFSNGTSHVTITDVRVHGMTNAGFFGPTGDQVHLLRVTLAGNASSGWNMDAGNGSTGTGTITFDQVQILWNGCAEEYPIAHPLPYQDCTDQNSSGYGDGIGTATAQSNPAWHMVIENSTAAYNTQDGFDLLHLTGNGSTLTISHSQAFSNMGQQLKVGATSATRNSLIVGNCNALRQDIPGTPPGYNSRLSNFCRAGDEAVAITVSDTAATYFQFNTLQCANATCVSIYCASSTCSGSSSILYQNNTFFGYKNNAENGYPGPSTGDYSNPIYTDSKVSGILANSGSRYDHNSTWHWKSNWVCPRSNWNEQNAVCIDPQFKDPDWHNYGRGDMAPLPGSPLVAAGITISGVTTDYHGNTRPQVPGISAIEASSAPPPVGYKLSVNNIGAGWLDCAGQYAAGQPFNCAITTQSKIVLISGCGGTEHENVFSGSMPEHDCLITAQFVMQ